MAQLIPNQKLDAAPYRLRLSREEREEREYMNALSPDARAYVEDALKKIAEAEDDLRAGRVHDGFEVLRELREELQSEYGV